MGGWCGGVGRVERVCRVGDGWEVEEGVGLLGV